jgi:hypothetical protein
VSYLHTLHLSIQHHFRHQMERLGFRVTRTFRELEKKPGFISVGFELQIRRGGDREHTIWSGFHIAEQDLGTSIEGVGWFDVCSNLRDYVRRHKDELAAQGICL